MPRQSVDLIEWDGHFLCVLMEPYLIVLEPFLRGEDEQGTDLFNVFTVDGHILPADKHPVERVIIAQAVALRTWQEWDVRTNDSLLRHPAVRIFVDPDYETVRQRGAVQEIIQRVFERRRAEKLDRIAKDSIRRRRPTGD